MSVIADFIEDCDLFSNFFFDFDSVVYVGLEDG